MRIIEPSVELVGANVPAFARAKHVELCGRVCYKSEDKITDGSAEKFIAGIIKRGHEAVLEHARITLDLSRDRALQTVVERVRKLYRSVGREDYLRSTEGEPYIVSGNMRAWRSFSQTARLAKLDNTMFHYLWAENEAFFPEFVEEEYKALPDMLITVDPGMECVFEKNPFLRLKHSWYTLRFICDRGVSHEIVRHRPASYCQESTRYCNYSKGQFNGEITVVKPCFLREGTPAHDWWEDGCRSAEKAYFKMLDSGSTPQEARDVLPASLKTELVMTATADEWLHFLALRDNDAAHPQMREVAGMARKILMEQDAELFEDRRGGH